MYKHINMQMFKRKIYYPVFRSLCEQYGTVLKYLNILSLRYPAQNVYSNKFKITLTGRKLRSPLIDKGINKHTKYYFMIKYMNYVSIYTSNNLNKALISLECNEI